MTIKQAYNSWSAIYDSNKNLTRDLDQIVTKQTLADLHFRSILELGCGTGKNTALLARIGDTVHALDFSPRMMARARERVTAGHVTFTEADLTQPWPVEDEAVDLIVCNLVLEHIADLPPIFAEAARTLRPNGRFFISELHPFRQYEGIQANFEIDGEKTEVQAFTHNISDFLNGAAAAGLTLVTLNEWWHDQDQNKPPRLVSFMFAKQTVS